MDKKGHFVENENNFNDDVLENLLENKKETKQHNDLDILKELFNKKDIETKTELGMNQIIIINKKRMLANLLDFPELNDLLNDFMILSISNKRKGRQEFIEGFKGNKESKENEIKVESKGLNRLFG